MYTRSLLLSLLLGMSLSCGSDSDLEMENAAVEKSDEPSPDDGRSALVGPLDQEAAPEIEPEGDIETGGVLFGLNLVGEESLVAVYHTTQQTHKTAAYEISTLMGNDIWFDGGRAGDSRIFNQVHVETHGRGRRRTTVPSIRFLGTDESRLMARVNRDSGVALLTGAGGEFDMSDSYVSISGGVPYGSQSEKIAYVGKLQSGNHQLILFDGAHFEKGPVGRRLSGLVKTPDQATVMYQLDRQYGVGTDLFSRRPEWVQIGSGGPWAFLGVRGPQSAVYIDYQTDLSFDSIRNFGLDPSGQRLLYQGVSEGAVQVVSESRVSGEAPRATYGPFGKITTQKGTISYHSQTGLPYFVAQSADGQRLVVGEAGNNLKSSDAFAKIDVKPVANHLASVPVAVATSAAGVQVLSGIRKGPAHAKITQLQVAQGGSSVLYIGQGELGQRVVLGSEPQEWFTTIKGLQQTTESGLPIYAGTKAEGESAVLNGKKSPAYTAIKSLRVRPGDSMAWLAVLETGNLVGIGTTPGKTFDLIQSIQVNRGHLWYDGVRGDRTHRVLETTESAGFTSIGPAVFTETTGGLVYSARVATTSTRTEPAVQEGKPDKEIVQAVIEDRVITGTETVGTHSRTMDLNATGKKLMAGKELPGISLIESTDHFYYAATSDKGITVGMNKETYGPFGAIKELKIRPSKNQLVWFALKGEQWAVQEGASRGVELETVSKLRFTPDAQQVRYEGTQAGVSLTFVGKEKYLAIKEEKLNRNQDLYTYQGQRNDGWHLVVDGSHSEAFAKMGGSVFTQDGYGIEVVSTQSSGTVQLLRKLHGQDFKGVGSHAQVLGTSKQYLKPLASGRRLVSDEGSGPYRLYTSSDLEITPTLPSGATHVVVIGKSLASISQAWVVSSVEGPRIQLKNGPTASALKKMQSRGTSVWIVPVDNYFSYPIKMDGKNRHVLNGESYSSVEGFASRKSRFYTANGNFMAVGRGSEDRLVFNNTRTQGYSKIRELFWPGGSDSPSNADDWVAMKVTDATQGEGWVLTHKGATVRELAFVEKLSRRDPTWTSLSSKNQHTLVWVGDAGQGMKTWVGPEWYDELDSRVQITPQTGILSYVGVRNGRHSVFYNGAHGDWFSSVRGLNFSGPEDSPVYVGVHQYLKSQSSVAVNSSGKQLMAVIHGQERGPWVDGIQYLLAGDSLASTTYTAAVDGMWQVYRGSESEGESFREIAWLTRSPSSTEDSELTLHFIGRLDDGWVEVHNGVRGVKIDAIKHGIRPGNSGLSVLSRQPNSDDSWVLVDGQGRYDYLAVVGGKQAIVRRGSAHIPFEAIESIQYFNGSEVMVYQGVSSEGRHLVIDGQKSQAYKALAYGPLYSSASNKVHAIMELSKKQLPEKAKDEPVDPYPDRYALLYGTEGVARMHAYDRMEVLPGDDGLGLMMKQGEDWRVYVNGEQGPAFTGLGEVVWRDTLAATRYVAMEPSNLVGKSPVFIAGKEKIAGPFSSVRKLDGWNGAGNIGIFWVARAGDHDQLWMDDGLTHEGERIRRLEWHGSNAVVTMTDENSSESQLKQTTVDAVLSVNSILGSRLLAVKNRGKTSLMLSSSQSEPGWVLYDLLVSETHEDATLSWLSASIDRSNGTMSLVPMTMTVAQSEMQELTPAFSG